MGYSENIKGFFCDHCKRYWGDNEEMSKQCCYHENPCPECGGIHGDRGSTVCRKCRDRHAAEKYQNQMRKATVVMYDGPFFVHGEFFQGVDHYLDSLDEGEEPEEFAFVPNIERVYHLNADDMVQNCIENINPDNYDDFEPCGMDELRAAVAAFNKANESQEYYFDDYTGKKFRILEGTD